MSLPSRTADPAGLSAGPPPDVGGPPIVRVRDLRVTFQGLQALDGVTLAVPRSLVTAVIGPNGAGKTTLLDCICGTCRHRGEIFLDGRPLHRMRAHRRSRQGVARTYQTPVLVDDLDVLANVMLGAHADARGRVGGRGGGEREGEVRERALGLLGAFGMAATVARPAGDLPHPDRRRVETARALMSRPRLLLLDEPSSGMDDREAAELLAVALDAARTCLLVSHDMHLVRSVAGYVVVLSAGRVLAAGRPEEVAAHPTVRAEYLGAGEPPARAVR